LDFLVFTTFLLAGAFLGAFLGALVVVGGLGAVNFKVIFWQGRVL
jgi:hypothetical protein